jgi:hypothetical protein
VVRDIGTALGETGRLDPRLFKRTRFIKNQELARHIAPEDVRWMCDLLVDLRVNRF